MTNFTCYYVENIKSTKGKWMDVMERKAKESQAMKSNES